MINLQPKRYQQIGLLGVLCTIAFTNYACAQGQHGQWPTRPLVVTAHPNNAEETDLIPSPILPPNPRSPGSDPLFSTVAPALGIAGTLAYFAQGWDGGQTPSYSVIVLRSLGGSCLLPAQHLGTPGTNLRSDVATYGFHEGEYDSGNPQLSPDGHVLLYEQIQPMASYGGCSLYEWDMRAGQVRQLTPNTIAYLNVFWSPDSHAVAYVNGGWNTGKPAQLSIVDRRTFHSQPVVLPDGVSLLFDSPVPQQISFTPIAWSSPTSLLLTGVQSTQKVPALPAHTYTAPAQPNIYEAINGKAHMVAAQAYNPSPSPNGRWLACFGWPQPQDDALKQRPPQSGPNIYLFDRYRGKRFFVRALSKFGGREAEAGTTPALIVFQWTHDSRQLIITETSSHQKQGAREATATISTLQVPSGVVPVSPQWAQALHRVTTLSALDSSDGAAIDFMPLQVSADGNHLFIAVRQTTDQKGGKPISESSLQRVNITNGQVDVLARFHSERLRGFDWHEEHP